MKILTCLLLLLVALSFQAPAGYAQLDLSNLPGLNRDDEEEDDDRPPALLPPQFAMSIREFMSSLGVDQTALLENARDALSGFSKGENLDGLKALDKLKTAGLSEDQRGLLQDAKVAIDQYILQRNFSELPEFSGPVNDVLKSLSSGKTEDITKQFQAILDAGSPTKEQRNLLKELISQAKSWY